MKTFKPPFKIGLKQGRAVLDRDGHEVVVFPKGCEFLALEYVELINEDLKGYQNGATAGNIAMKYGVAVGRIGCPHCGIVAIGAITTKECDWCEKDRFNLK